MGKFVQTNIAPKVAVLFEFEQIFLSTGGEAAAHAASALIPGQAMILGEGLCLVLLPLGKIGGDLVAANDVELDAGGEQVGKHQGLPNQQVG